jgi:hypothetical protein
MKCYRLLIVVKLNILQYILQIKRIVWFCLFCSKLLLEVHLDLYAGTLLIPDDLLLSRYHQD